MKELETNEHQIVGNQAAETILSKPQDCLAQVKTIRFAAIDSAERYEGEHAFALVEREPLIAVWDERQQVTIDLRTADLRFTERGRREVRNMLKDESRKGKTGYYFSHIRSTMAHIRAERPEAIAERLRLIISEPLNVKHARPRRRCAQKDERGPGAENTLSVSEAKIEVLSASQGGNESPRMKTDIVVVTSKKGYRESWERAVTKRQPFIAYWKTGKSVELDLDPAGLRLTDAGMDAVDEMYAAARRQFGIRRGSATIGATLVRVEQMPTQWVAEQLQLIVSNRLNVESWEDYYRRRDRSHAVSSDGKAPDESNDDPGELKVEGIPN